MDVLNVLIRTVLAINCFFWLGISIRHWFLVDNPAAAMVTWPLVITVGSALLLVFWDMVYGYVTDTTRAS